MRLWLVEVVSGVPEPLVEHDDLRWLANGQWLDVPWLDADVRIVESLVGALANGTFHTV
jgi:8-oxo-dGTP diphosphatase